VGTEERVAVVGVAIMILAQANTMRAELEAREVQIALTVDLAVVEEELGGTIPPMPPMSLVEAAEGERETAELVVPPEPAQHSGRTPLEEKVWLVLERELLVGTAVGLEVWAVVVSLLSSQRAIFL